MSEFKVQNLGPLAELFDQIMAFQDEDLTNEVVESLEGMIKGAITPAIYNKTINDTLTSFNDQNFTKQYAREVINNVYAGLDEYIEELQPSIQKKYLLNSITNFIHEIFDEVLKQYHSYNFELPIKLENEAHVPMYAHDTDAAADIYALEDMTLAPHSLSNVVHTGLRIALPEGWAAYILPRSSIGMKTGLRLSNSVGVIDSDYRGEIGVMYDNHSDSEYVIHKGDRIAQMIVMPICQFKPQVVDILGETERGDGGFGSTGK